MRIDSLDILKGIGIILVVVGHMIGNQLYIRPWIYAFHMPLFFMVSGYCFNIAKHPKWLSFARVGSGHFSFPVLYIRLLAL